MKNPDAQRRFAPGSDIDETETDEFYETLVPTAPTQTYRSGTPLGAIEQPSLAERIVRLAASILGILLGLRFIINLFGGYNQSLLSSIVNALTNWMVRPFQILFGVYSAATGSFIDWPALIALIVLGIVAGAIVRWLQPAHL